MPFPDSGRLASPEHHAATSVRELYCSEVDKLFRSYPPGDASRTELHDEIRARFRDLATFLAKELPPCPELWRAVQELHVGMMLANAAVAANWSTVVASR